MTNFWMLLLTLTMVFGGLAQAAGQDAADLLKQAAQALNAGKTKEALTLASQAAGMAPQDPKVFFFRGSLHDALGKNKEAAHDFGAVLKLDTKHVEAHYQRGRSLFKLGDIAGSIRAFDKYVELNPKRKVSLWERGISYYYGKQYDDGRRQLEGYQTFDSNDVENAVWRYMCMAKAEGIAKARQNLLKIGPDKRVPMREVYEMFSGRLKPEEVVAAAKAGHPSKKELDGRLFYAHLYIGIHYDIEGDSKKALEHLTKAAEEYRIPHYMGDVARIHRDLLKKQQQR